MSAEKQFAKECLDAMNRYRSNHQVSPLTYNDEIEQVAKRWADHLAQQNRFDHNPNRKFQGSTLGENIAMRQGCGITGAQFAEQWYSEIKDYDFQSHRGRGVTGHFTQVVWKDTKEVGIARSQTKDGAWIVVADYFPPGNFNNDDANNVFPPRDGKLPPQTSKDQKHSVQQQPAKSFSTNTSTQVKKSTVNGVTTTTTIITETTTDEEGAKKVKVTEKVERPDGETKVTVTETTM